MVVTTPLKSATQLQTIGLTLASEGNRLIAALLHAKNKFLGVGQAIKATESPNNHSFTRQAPAAFHRTRA